MLLISIGILPVFLLRRNQGGKIGGGWRGPSFVVIRSFRIFSKKKQHVVTVELENNADFLFTKIRKTVIEVFVPF